MGMDVHFIEIGPRDGFQSVSDFIPTEIKLDVIDKIVRAGVKDIQATSFVSPKAIPQMRDAREIMQTCLYKYPEVSFSALVPNYRGAANACEAGTPMVSFVISVSERHNMANVRHTVQASFAELREAIRDFPQMKFSLDAATVFGCPFKSEVTFDMVKAFVQTGIDVGVAEICLCDTMGIADPNQVRTYIASLKSAFPETVFNIHIHDTRNMGMVNTLAAIETGIDGVQTSLSGLGGCPFAPGATGNTSSEDLLYMLEKMGYALGVDVEQMIAAAKFLRTKVPGGNYSGHHINIDMYTAVCAEQK